MKAVDSAYCFNSDSCGFQLLTLLCHTFLQEKLNKLFQEENNFSLVNDYTKNLGCHTLHRDMGIIIINLVHMYQ